MARHLISAGNIRCRRQAMRPAPWRPDKAMVKVRELVVCGARNATQVGFGGGG